MRCLPKPLVDKERFNSILESGFKRFPKRKENYDKYISFKRNSTILNYDPLRMDYEVSSRCNFRCKMCLISEIGNSRPKNMKYEDFKNSLNELYGLIEIKLQGLGEPLLNKDFIKMIELAVDRDIWVRTTINGSLLHINGNYKKIIDANPGEIVISIDGASKEVFESIRVGADFYKVVDNVTKLNEYSNSQNLLRTRCWMLVQKDNFTEMEDVLRLAVKMGFRRLTYSIGLNNWGKENWENINSPNNIEKEFNYERGIELIELGQKLGIEVTFWDANDKYKISEDKMKICQWPFERAFISADMKIVPCCTICDPNISNLGDAKEFMKYWNKSQYEELRKMHISGKVPYMCRNCYDLKK